MRLMSDHQNTLPKPQGPFSRMVRLDAGASAVEFALIIPFLLMLAGGIVEMTNLFFVRSELNEIVRDATRRFAVDALTQDETRQYVADQVAEATNAQGEITVSESAEQGADDTTDVTVSLDIPVQDILIFDFVASAIKVPGGGPRNLSVSVTMLKH